MGIRQTLVSQGAGPHGPLGWITASIMPLLSDAYCGDLARLLDLRPEDDLLDVACGSGVFLQKRAAHVRHIAGIDHSAIQIHMARKRNRDRIARGTAEFVQGDSAPLPWENDRFSVVTCNCIGCFQEPRRSLQEMYRVLRPGGRAALSIDHFPDSEMARKQELKWGLPSWTDLEFRTMVDDVGFSGVAIFHERALTLVKAVKSVSRVASRRSSSPSS